MESFIPSAAGEEEFPALWKLTIQSQTLGKGRKICQLREFTFPPARVHFSTSVVNGIIYAIGGSHGIGPGLVTVEAYNPETDTWERKKDLLAPRALFSTSVVEGKIYVIGGGSANAGDAKIYTAVEVYDPVIDTWRKETDLPTPRLGLSTNIVDGKIYAIGGGPWVALSTVEVYEPATGTWTKETGMPTPKYYLSTSAVDGKIYAIGGGPSVNVNYQKAIVEAFDTGSIESKSVNPAGKLSTTWGEVKATR
jgi:N-acetylneuraminic acid mutarotase